MLILHLLWNIAAFILALGVLITVHEFGHFLIARYCGVTVERFSIGFGRALWHWRDKRGTEYVIAAIPLGGYVKMLEERIDTVVAERSHEAFNQKTVGQRAIIIAAGPLFNFLFAIVAYWLVFLIGVPSYRPVIGEIAPNSIAAQAKFYPGMEVKSVAGIETPDWDAVRVQLLNQIDEGKSTISVVLLGGSPKSEKKSLDVRGWKFKPDREDIIVTLGIMPLCPRIQPVLAAVQPGSAAMTAGLQAGDRIVTIDGQAVSAWRLFVTRIRDNPGRPLQLSIDRHGEALDITLKPDSKVVGKGEVVGFAGVVPKIISLPAQYKTVRHYSPLPALALAEQKTWQLMRITISMLGKLFTGDVKLNNVSGPISMAYDAGMSAEYGLIYYLMFLALISVNLGIINLFPLPVLDGGHLLFLAIEKVKGGPVSERVQEVSYRIGAMLLVLLMGMALLNDISRLL